MAYQAVFKRKEMKYLITDGQYNAMTAALKERMVPDDFAYSRISNLYYDTPDFRLIRESLAKPKYKEKLRLRCYDIPDEQTKAFLEIKKKYAGIVYKRRVTLPYQEAVAYLAGESGGGTNQIFRELTWMLRSYERLAPAMFLYYDRCSWKNKGEAPIRITFDQNIRWRTEDLDLSQGTHGEPLLLPGQKLMEIKISNAMPLWLAQTLSDLRIYPTSFSKYGKAYKMMLRRNLLEKREEEERYA